MSGYHRITETCIGTRIRNGWKIVNFRQFLEGSEMATSHTTGLPYILSHIREDIHIRGLRQEVAEKILDGIVSLLIDGRYVIEPGDTIAYGTMKFLVLRESVPSSIWTEEKSILVLRRLDT